MCTEKLRLHVYDSEFQKSFFRQYTMLHNHRELRPLGIYDRSDSPKHYLLYTF